MTLMQGPVIADKPEGRVIAVTGKGGVGKTVLTALMTVILARQGDGRRVLAIDADSAVSLPYILGLPVTGTVSDIRDKLISDPRAKRDIEDIPMKRVIGGVLHHAPGIDLLVMGRPEGPGCFCLLNDLLRYGIETLSRDYDVTLVDCEAGPEQVNRRVVRIVDTLLIVSDSSVRGIRTAAVIKKVAERGGEDGPARVGLVINKVRRGSTRVLDEATEQHGLKRLGHIPHDPHIARLDLLGRPVFELPRESPALASVRSIVREIGLL